MELFYSLSQTDMPLEEKNISLKHFLLLNAYIQRLEERKRNKSNLFDTRKEIGENGRYYSFDEIGTKPKKLFLGVCCNQENPDKLIGVAKNFKH